MSPIASVMELIGSVADIKPENILMTSWRDGARVVLTDFGQSRTIVDLENAAKSAGIGRMHSLVGTYGYTAP